MTARTHFVVGTAGHVDHGKTALVKALTGTDTDRLAEEKARGITIELGFARWNLGGGVAASVVDVPGHERFVHTMVAGATGIDVVLLVVAADDGVMPQTREHLAICSILGLEAGVVAITKSDLADAETLELVREDVRSATRGTFLEGAEVVACSAREGTGLDELGRAVLRALPRASAHAQSGAAFLAIDRVFSKAGAGDVVTGTLLRGTVRAGDELDAMPSASGGVARVRVRGIHVHDAPAPSATASTRVALNVKGDDEGALRRGSVLATPGWQAPTLSLMVEVTLVPESPPLKGRSELVLHLGTSHRTVRASVVGGGEIAPGGKGLVRLAAREPVVAYAGQRVVLRRPDLDAFRTVGGGAVVDPHPGPRRTRPASAAPAASTRDRILERIEESRYAGITGAELARRALADDDVNGALAGLTREGLVVQIPGKEPTYVARKIEEEGEEAILATLRAFHAERPVVSGLAALELETRQLPRLRAAAPVALARLVASGRLVEERGLVRLREHAPRASDAAAKVANLYARAGLAPPSDEDVRAEAGIDSKVFRDVLGELKREGRLRMLSGGLHYDTIALGELAAKVTGWFLTHDKLTPPDLKALAGLTRKHAIPLLEWLDAEGVTRRVGDARVAGPKGRAGPP